MKNKRRIPAAAIIAAALGAVWLLIEILSFVFALPTAPFIKGEDFCLTEKEEEGFSVYGERKIRFSAECGRVESVTFVAKGDFDAVMTVSVLGYDPSNSANLLTYTSEKFAIGYRKWIKSTVSVDIPENAGDFFLVFEYDDVDYKIDGIVFNDRSGVRFNIARLLTVWGFIAVFAAVKHFKLFSVCFDPQKRTHGASALALCMVCVLIAALMATALCSSVEDKTEYPFAYSVNYYNPYEQQFDAFMKGQLHIDFKPSEELLELENPYDPAERDGVYYLWDRAFYEGKYYSYFGIGPIIAVYAPYYFLTGDLPAYDTLSWIFTLLTALFLSMAAVKWAAMYTKRLPMPILWLGTVGLLFASQIFLVMRGHTRFYYIATVSGMAFLSAFVWLLLCGISGGVGVAPPDKEPKKWKKPLLFALAGIAYGLCFLSRYNMALLAAFFIIPALWFGIISEKRDGKRSLRQIRRVIPELSALALPVLIAMTVQLWLNYARFDNIFEFGTTYQLTVSDVSKNKLRLSDLPYAIFHYFLQPLTFTSDFPFVSLFYTRLNSYGHYAYIDTGMGLMAIPMMWSLLAAPFVFVDKKTGLGKKVTLGATILGTVTVALLDFCLGGVIFRYTCDLTLVGAFASMAIIFSLCDGEEKCADTVTVKRTNGAVTALLWVSVLTCLSLAFSLNANLTPYSSGVYVWFRSLFLW